MIDEFGLTRVAAMPYALKLRDGDVRLVNGDHEVTRQIVEEGWWQFGG